MWTLGRVMKFYPQQPRTAERLVLIPHRHRRRTERPPPSADIAGVDG